MGYLLQAIISKRKMSEIIMSELQLARRVWLKEDLYILPYYPDFYDEFNQYEKSEDFDKFEYLNKKLYNYLINKSAIEPVAYIEAEYFGGTGGQSAIMLDKSEKIVDIRFEDSGYGAINTVLKEFGVKKESNLDEWDTVGMLRHRSTEDWLEDAED